MTQTTAEPSPFDRVPPSDDASEKALIGALLLDWTRIDEATDLVAAKDFYDPAHEIIFRHIQQIASEGRPVDVAILQASLKKKEEWDEIGGAPTLAKLAQSVPHAGNCEYYAKAVAEKSVLRSCIAAGQDILAESLRADADADDTLAKAESAVFAISEGRTHKQDPQSLQDALISAMTEIDRRKGHGRQPGSVDTGFKVLDDIMCGLRPGHFIVLAARPSMGKSALALNIAESVVIEEGKKALFISLEMRTMALVERLLLGRAGVNSHHARSGQIDAEERGRITSTAGEICDAQLYIEDDHSLTMSRMASLARRWKRKKGLDLLVIDYLQLIQADDPRLPRQEQVATIARSLKHLARQLDIPVLCLAQLNRGSESAADRRPTLANLRESGAIEQDADVVWLLHRAEYYKATPDNKGIADVIVAKQREGPTGEIQLHWSAELTRFGNLVDTVTGREQAGDDQSDLFT